MLDVREFEFQFFYVHVRINAYYNGTELPYPRPALG